MSVTRTFAVRMVGDAQQLIKEFNKVGKNASDIFGKNGVGGALSNLIPSFKTISIAATAAFGAVTAAAGLAVKAALEDAESQELLAQTIKTTFGESEALRVETEKLISQFQKSAAVADDKLRPAFSTLVRATGDFTQSQKLLQVALDVSAGTGRDLESVTIALARASNGSVTALTRLGVPLDQNAVKAKDFDKIVASLADTFEGQASVKANSAAGRFRAFGIAVDELREQFGVLLLPTVIKVVDFFTDRLIPAVQLAIAQFQSSGVRSALAYFVAAFGDTGKAAIEIIRNVALAVVDLGGQIEKAAAVIALGAVPILGISGAYDLYNKIVGTSQRTTDSINKTFDQFAGQVDYARKKLDILAQGPMDMVERRLAQTTRTARGAKNAMGEFGDEADDAGKKTKGAADKIKSVEDRLKEYSKAAKSAKSASEAYGKSQQRVEKAQLSVSQANDAVAKAQKELMEAQMGGDAAKIGDAQRKLAAAERGLARSKFSVEEAAIGVRDAEKRLAEVRGDSESTADDIRKAEIALAEAQFNVADSQDRVIEQTSDLDDARRQLRIATEGLREGDAELVPFQDAVTSAQLRSKEAADDLKEAFEDSLSALDEYKQALADLAQAIKDFPKIAGANPVTGLIPIPEVPAPAGTGGGGGTNPSSGTSVVVNVTAGIGGNAYQVGKEIIEVLDQYTSVAGPLDTLMRVA